jgi:predicted  nucleic acid-binding Zn-ribbon protein
MIPVGPATRPPTIAQLEYQLRELQRRSRELAKRQAALLASIRATEVELAVMRAREPRELAVGVEVGRV